LLIAVPIAYLLCASIFTIAICVGMATDGYPDADKPRKWRADEDLVCWLVQLCV
jgi:hypothetical protein